MQGETYMRYVLTAIIGNKNKFLTYFKSINLFFFNTQMLYHLSMNKPDAAKPILMKNIKMPQLRCSRDKKKHMPFFMLLN